MNSLKFFTPPPESHGCEAVELHTNDHEFLSNYHE